MKGLEIKGFVEASFCDWDGKIAAVIFLGGCNLRCPFCQNGELVLHPETIPSVDFLVLRDHLLKNQEWIDGVVVTGGEPTLWDDLGGLLQSMKRLGLGVKLDTNGTNPGVLEDLLSRALVDYVAMDIKGPLDERYARLAGTDVDLDAIRRSIAIIRSALGPRGAYEFRTTLVPGLIGEAEVTQVARAISGAARYVLQQFIPQNALARDLRRAIPYSDDAVSRLLDAARPHVGSCFFRGKVAAAVSSAGGPI
ncbi:MAG TPA: anaerobic ribonucleoside-triphosphate reductase activating protein [bacterium]|nr:anaerobic ribonucleoside-triphosphate reductase activating protein [bacterium]